MATLTAFGSAAIPTSAVAAAAKDSLGTDFWLAFPGNLSTPELTLFITGPTGTTGTVTALGSSQSFSVTPGSVTSVTLDPSLDIQSSDTVEDLGIHVTANAEVTVYGLNRVPQTTDAYLGLPTDILGQEYLVQGYKNVDIVDGTEFALVATANSTTVTITPSVTTDGHAAGTAFTVNLNQGQTYQLRNTDAAPADLSGSSVTSNHPIAVFGGHQCANIPSGDVVACDHIVEEMTPTATWGKSFVTEPLATRTGGDTYRFLADTDNTTVKVNGSTVATLNRGQLFEQLLSAASVVTSDKPILVTQYSNSTSFDGVTSDPFEVIVPPAEQFLNSYTVTTPASGFDINFINVVAPTASLSSVKLDGSAVPPSSFTAIPGSSFSGAQLPVGLGTHNLTGSQPFGITVYGFAEADSYGYPGGLSLAPVATVTSVSLAPKTGSNAINTQHCVTATVQDQNNVAVSGVRVDYTVTGVNPTTGFANTTANGTAQFCYTGTHQGSDSIKAAVGTVSDTASEQWTQGGSSPTLTVVKSGNGSGTVGSSPSGISCGSTCSASFTSGTVVTLTETPASGSTFTGWSGGGCSGSATTCQVTLTANTSVTATFTTQVGTGITVTPSTTPKTVTGGSLAKTHFTIRNTTQSTIHGVVATVQLPAGATPVSISTSSGGCSGFTNGKATCLYGDIAGGGTRGIDVTFTTPTGGTGQSLVVVNATSSDAGTATGSGGPTLVASKPGFARGFVPPGGSISTGSDPTAANPFVATFELPRTGSGAPITLRTETAGADTFCGGQPCAGRKILFLSPFTGYNDPNRPPELTLKWDTSIVGTSTTFAIYVQKVDNGPITTLPNCRNYGSEDFPDVADPHPCVELRKVHSNGDAEAHIFLLSGDPRFARR